MSIFSSKWASSPPGEKPLPLPPTPKRNERLNEAFSPRKDSRFPSLASPQASESPRPTPAPRPRTKLAWKGKACWIALPTSDPESKPLSSNEVEARLHQLEEAGYDVRGFDLEPGFNHGTPISQSRAEFPETGDAMANLQEKKFKVCVPNPQLWKSHIDDLLEQKLRALGVSTGDDPAPVPPPMSRQSSGHFQSVSPNLMHAGMAGASHRSTPSLAHFPTPGHSYSASVASPLSMPGDPRGHAHRHSVFGMPGMPFGFPNQQNNHSGLPAFSPGTHFNMNGIPRVSSPALDRLKPDGQSARSPVSPYGMPYPLSRSPQPGEWPGQAHYRHQSVYNNFSPQPQPSITPTITPGPSARKRPSLAEVPEDEEEPMQDYFAGATPRKQQTHKDVEIVHPSPRHNRNISNALEREIQGSHYHLEKAFERQIQDEEDAVNTSFVSQTSSSAAYVPPGKRASLNNGFQGTESSGFAGASLQPGRALAKDSVVGGGPAGAPQNKLTNKVKGHASRLSVAAPEFKFQPAMTFQPTLPSLPTPSNYNQNHIRDQSSDNLDFSAPSFQPSGFGAVPTSDFSFASSFEFNPMAAAQQPPAYQMPQATAGESIFGNVPIPEVVKPARRSKAVAIVQPKSSPVKEEPELEDENGRAAQSEERQKRARVGQSDGDDVPLFAERPASPVRPTAPEQVSASEPDKSELSIVEEVRPSSAETETEKPAARITSVQDFETLAEIPSKQSDHGHKKNSSSLSAFAKPFEFKPQSSTSSTQAPETLLRSPDPNRSKPDFSPARVFSHVSRGTADALATVEDLDYAPSPEPQKHTPYPNGETGNTRFPEPTFDEIDAVMQQLNDDDEEAHVYQGFGSDAESLDTSVIHHSPVRTAQNHVMSSLPEFTMGGAGMHSAPINRLNRNKETPLSEWSDDLSADEGTKVRTRSQFFDGRVDHIVGNVIETRLAPLEKSLQLIHRAVSTIMTREPRPATVRSQSAMDSDADDEEDDLPNERQAFRPMSRAKDRKISQIKAAVLEALATQQSAAPQLSSSAEIHQALMDMNTTIARMATANIDIDDVKHVVDESLNRMGQSLIPAAPAPATTEAPEATEKHKREVSELHGRLNKTLADALEEANQRRTIEEREVETRRLLRLAEEELSLLRETMGDKDQRIHTLEAQRIEMETRAEQAEAAHSRDEQQLSDLEAENSALKSTLEEYRISSSKWRKEVDDTSSENDILKAQLEETRKLVRKSHQDADNVADENNALKATATDLLMQLDESKSIGKRARQAADDAAVEATAIKASAAELMAQLEESQMTLKLTKQSVDDSSVENAALKASVTSLVAELEDSRHSVRKWQQEANDTARENDILNSTVSDLKAQIADGLNIRENMRNKLDKIHNGMISAAEQLANQKAVWQNRNEELQKKYVVMQARLEGENSVRRSIEEEVQSLRAQVHEGITTKIELEQMQRSTALHEDTLRTLKENLTNEQTLTARLERDLHEARESGRAEVQRTQMIMQSSIEAAESQANIMRSSLEHELLLARNEIENVKMVSDATRERHDHLLGQEADLRRDALRKVNEASSVALNDLRDKHADEIRYIKAQYERTLANAYEDKQRTTAHFNDRLELSNDQVLYLRDKVAHLEERLQIAKSAAQAAASAARGAKAAPVSAPSVASNARDGPEKISPQALRESILVLQEQLQERETRIERLETEMSELDTSAPSKLKEKEIEVSWLRELLAVRNEDLNELVTTLSKPKYDKEAVKDFAIRIQANLQMEQQEKERLINAGPSLTGQAFANLTNFASPKAVSLAAAFGNWRNKGKDLARPLSAGAPSASAARAAVRASASAKPRLNKIRTGTPSKPSPAPSPSVFAGLMTPPATNLRRTPSPSGEGNMNAGSRLSFSKLSQSQEIGDDDETDELRGYFDRMGQNRSAEEDDNPNVFRRQSYDDDAQLGEDVDVDVGAADEEEEEDDRGLDEGDGGFQGQTAEELVGRSLASELEVV